MNDRSLRFLILLTPFALAACGEGYDMIRTDAMFPYGNQRTAGTGVAYVLAKMAPERELNLNTVERKQEAKPMPDKAEDVSVQEERMEQLFDEALKK